ncbi:hypothetical protein BVG16_13635 [Paenibacillus selenitireducens]|uniref:ORF6C domain-containing protein n=1 Tax=Paenibacillus selenitireducens TaxID=1324314 RepID=A0A1T2XC70_9BACL|nr:ORF6C domain-containing protein [Paenibacillus selenitireducens]OPA77491.1 hypothetical protein BVG16_13635 [Paenibacillus selenitireducens]
MSTALQVPEWNQEEQIERLIAISTNFAHGAGKQDKRIGSLEQRMNSVESKMTCDSRHQNNINDFAKRSISKVLGSAAHPDYRKTISALWADYRRIFGINSYRDTLVADYDRAIDWIRLWRPVTKREGECNGSNAID